MGSIWGKMVKSIEVHFSLFVARSLLRSVGVLFLCFSFFYFAFFDVVLPPLGCCSLFVSFSFYSARFAVVIFYNEGRIFGSIWGKMVKM